MYLKSLSLQNFRSYKKTSFDFNEATTIIVGRNTAGKTNLLEAIYFLATGRSFRNATEEQVLRFGEQVTRIQGITDDATKLEVVISSGELVGKGIGVKKYLVNGVAKSRANFASHVVVVFFSPLDLDVITGSPSIRRGMLNDLLEQTDRDYRLALLTYTKALRQRNALLEQARETGCRADKSVFAYWENLLIKNGQYITQKRAALLDFINTSVKDIFDCTVVYDNSVISQERLLQYKDAEAGAGVTLVGPHRDDFNVQMYIKSEIRNPKFEMKDVALFGSRGQQRLVVLQLKLLAIAYIEKMLGVRPILLLDDIFSELDEGHIALVSEMIGKNQTIITTTHEEFVKNRLLEEVKVIILG